MSTNPRSGIPLVADRNAFANQNHTSLMRMLFAAALGDIQHKSPEAIVRENWPDDTTASLLTRAAVTPTTTTSSGFPMLTAVRLLPSLAPKSAGSAVLGRAGLKLDFSQKYQFYLTHLGALPDLPWIGEGGAFPVVPGLLTGWLFGPPSKLGFMSGYTNELEEYAVEDAFTLFSRVMTETAKGTLDKVLFSTAAATSKSQAGLLYGVTPLTATTGGGLTALVGDLKAMAGAMATAGITSDGAIIVAHPQQVEVLNTLPPQPLKHEVYGTTAVPVGTVIMIQTEGLVTGYDGDAMIFMSPDATTHMESVNPQNIGTVGSPNVVAAPTVSAFQTDSKILKLVLRCAWGIRPGAIQWTQTVTW